MRSLCLCALFWLWASCNGQVTSATDAGDSAETRCGDTSDDPMNCGACDRVCVIPSATAGCSLGDCVIAACPSGFSDNDGEIANGCELGPGEEAGPPVCREDKSELCNAFDDNCDGVCDEGRASTCRQGVHRGYGENHHIFSSALSDVQTAPYSLELENFFYTYSAPGVGLVEAYLCIKADSTHFLTTSASCEGAGTIVRSVGYWASSAGCDSVALYRLYLGSSNNHFFTTSASERDNASANLATCTRASSVTSLAASSYGEIDMRMLRAPSASLPKPMVIA